MPNHVTNIIETRKEVIDYLINDEGAVDFNKVIPMPEALNMQIDENTKQWARIATGEVDFRGILRQAQSGRPNPDVLQVLKDSNALQALLEGVKHGPHTWDDERFEQFIASIRCIKEYGHESWYEWSTEVWGTKWNAYETNRSSDNKVSFQTAWNMPENIILKLVSIFPEDRIVVTWADEDFGNNCGTIIYEDGKELVGGPLENQSDEAMELAAQVLYNGELPEYMARTEDGKIVYVNEDEE